jgi:hypothetical protein
MRGAMTLPIWVVALLFAIVAPFAAKAVASVFERWARERSRQIVFRAATSIDDTLRTN